MKLSTSLVAVKKIISKVERAQFSDSDLNQAAKLILEAEGVINPIVLHRTSVESYEVVDGDFEYYAAVRAREIDPRKGEMIGAFIIEPQNEEVIKEQIRIIRMQGSKDDYKQKGKNPSQENVKSYTDVEQAAEAIKRFNEIDIKQTNTQNKLEIITDKIEQVAEVVKRLENFLIKSQETKDEKGKKIEIKPTVYDGMTREKLKKIAKEQEIKVTTRMTKTDIINALVKANLVKVS